MKFWLRTLDKNKKIKDLKLPLQRECLDFYAKNHAKISEKMFKIMEAEGIKKTEYQKIAEELNRILNRFGGQLEQPRPIQVLNTVLNIPESIKISEGFKAEDEHPKIKDAGMGYWQKIVKKIDDYTQTPVPKEISIDVVAQLAEAKSERFSEIEPTKFAKKADVSEFVRGVLSNMLDANSQPKLKRKKFSSFHISSIDHGRSSSLNQIHSNHDSHSDIFTSKQEYPSAFTSTEQLAGPFLKLGPRTGFPGLSKPVTTGRALIETRHRSTLASSAWKTFQQTARPNFQTGSPATTKLLGIGPVRTSAASDRKLDRQISARNSTELCLAEKKSREPSGSQLASLAATQRAGKPISDVAAF